MKIIIITLSLIFSFESLAHISKQHDNLFGWGKSDKEEVTKSKKTTVKKPKKVVKKPKKVVKKPKKIVRKPRRIIKRPARVVKKPRRIVRKPRRLIKKRNIRPAIQRAIMPQRRQFQRIKTIKANVDYMPEAIATPGKCYASAYIENSCSDIEKRVVVKDGYIERVIVPAVTKLIQERVLIREALIVEEVVPPLYEIIENKILIKAAHVQWKKGNFTATQKVIGSDTYCLVEVPAKYRIERRKVLRIKGSIVKKQLPAVYKVFDRVVVIKEEGVKTKRVIPQRHEKVKECLSLGGYYEWTSILCSENATETVLIKIEKTLNQKGFLNPSFVDGIIDSDTEQALREYQKSKKFKVSGLLTIKTVDSLGVKY
jgi:hypothetical protein